MAKILIAGNAVYPTVQARGIIGQAAGHDIYWVSAHPSPHAGVHSYCLPESFRGSMIKRAVTEPFLVSRAIRQVDPDILHVHHASKAFSALPLSRKHPLIVSVMGSDIMPDQAFRGIYKPFIKRLLDSADCITSKTEYMDKALLKIGDYQKKIRRVTWGIDLAHFRRDRDVEHLRTQYNIDEGDLVLFDPRAATPFYNKHIILEAFNQFLKNGGKQAHLIVLTLAPDHRYLATLQAMAEAFQIRERVHFVDKLAHEAMADYFALSNVTISIPPSDGFPHTIYEAFACGSFPILGDLPQYHEAVEHEKSGYLVPIGQVESLAKAIDWFVDHPEVIRQFKITGREYAKKHADKDEQTRIMNSIYSDYLRAT